MKQKKGNKITRKRAKTRHHRTFKKRDYQSGDGMLTTVWGPGMWHFLHTMSFNYPVHPTKSQKTQYRNFILSLQYVLPCKHCRDNLTKNFKTFPLRMCDMENRDTFSKYVYRLHEIVNKMLGKSSKLTYCDVRERYEHFRSRCTLNDDTKKVFNFNVFANNQNNQKEQDEKEQDEKEQEEEKDKKKEGANENGKEKGCTEPLYGEKSKCVLKIIPENERGPTFTIDNKCVKRRKDQ
jgi:hypothetical protein